MASQGDVPRRMEMRKLEVATSPAVPDVYAVTLDGRRVGTIERHSLDRRSPWISYAGWGEGRTYLGRHFASGTTRPLQAIFEHVTGEKVE